MSSSKDADVTVVQRLLQETADLARLTGYFYIAFVAIILYKATVLHTYGIRYVVWGAAFVKAVLMAKFLLLGQAMKIGEGYNNAPLIKPIIHKAFGFLILLVVLTGMEQSITGLLHHKSWSAALHQLVTANGGEKLAEILLLLLVLLPLVGFSVIGKALGEGRLTRMLFSNPKGAQSRKSPKKLPN